MRANFFLPLLLVLLVGAVSCAVGPDYSTPQFADIPSQWTADRSTPSEFEVDINWIDLMQDAQLQQLVLVAASHNTEIAEAAERMNELQSLRRVSLSELGPSVTLGAEYRRSKESGTLALFPGGIVETRYSAGAQLSWELDLFGRVRRNIEAARADLGSAVATHRAVLLSVLSTVASDYVALRTAQARLNSVESSVQSQSKSVGLVRKMVQAGSRSAIDLARAESLLGEVESRVGPLATEVQRLIVRLGVLTGRPPAELLSQLTARTDIPSPQGQVPLGVPSDLLRRRPDIVAAERDLAADTARIGVRAATLFPTFSITGEIGARSATQGALFTDPSEVFSIAPGFQWPIFSWRRILEQVDAADSRARQRLLRYQRVTMTAIGEVETAIVGYRNAQNRQAALNRALDAAGRAAKLASQQYEAGLTDFLDKLDADRALYSIEEEAVNNRGEVSQQFIALCRSLGGGIESYVAQS